MLCYGCSESFWSCLTFKDVVCAVKHLLGCVPVYSKPSWICHDTGLLLPPDLRHTTIYKWLKCSEIYLDFTCYTRHIQLTKNSNTGSVNLWNIFLLFLHFLLQTPAIFYYLCTVKTFLLWLPLFENILSHFLCICVFCFNLQINLHLQFFLICRIYFNINYKFNSIYNNE